MKKNKKLYHFLIVMILSVLTAGYSTMAVDSSAQINGQGNVVQSQNYKEGQVLVIFQKGVRQDMVRSIAASRGFRITAEFKTLSKLMGKSYVVMASARMSSQGMIRALKGVGGVEKVELDYEVTINTVPNDPYYPYQWGLDNTGQTGGTADADIDAPEAWDVTTGSDSVIIADIDTGVDYKHPDLTPNIWVNPDEIAGNGIDDDGNAYVDDIHGINSITNSGDPMDDNGHGTHTSGTIAAAGNNSAGVSGVCWNAKIMGLKFLAASGSGTTSNSIKCMDYILDKKVNKGLNIVAVNASWGSSGYGSQAQYDAIKALGDAGIIFVAAAGNNSTDNEVTPHTPSSYDLFNIIAVTATDHKDAQVFNYGLNSVDVGAPGVNILSTGMGRYIPQAGDIFFDDMEGNTDKWETGGTLNTWAISDNQELFANPSFPVPSPTHFWSDSPAANYQASTDSWLAVKDSIDLTSYAGQNVWLGIGSAWGFRLNDHGYTEVSGDGGTTWTIIGDFTNKGYYWQNTYRWLIPEAVKTANFKFRFHVVSNADATVWAGWLIDNVGVGNKISYVYEYMSGTSMATPHVTGAVGLLAAKNPSESMPDRILKILTGGDTIPSLAGKCTSGKRLNLLGCLSVTAYPPYILSVSPATFLTPGTSFTLTGYYFTAHPGQVLWVDGTGAEAVCPIISWTDTIIQAVAPNVPYGKYSVIVKNEDGVRSYNAPVIDSWYPGTPVFSEEFEGEFLSTGWSVVDNAATGLVWTRNDLIGSTNYSGGAGNCATANSDALDNANLGMDTDLLSPTIFLNPGYDRIVLTFKHLFGFYTGSQAAVDISTDDGATWTNLAVWKTVSKGPCTETLELTAYKGKRAKLRFHYTDGKTWSWFWDLDDVQILTWGTAANVSEDAVVAWKYLGVWSRNSSTNSWSLINELDAYQTATGDFDGNQADDIIGWWKSEPDAIWLRYDNEKWEFVLDDTDLVAISAGDLNGDGQDDLVGSWTFGCWWRDSKTGAWAELNPLCADLIACGDHNGDGKDDVAGSWKDAGVWIYDSGASTWTQLTADGAGSLAMGDWDGDGKEDLVGGWIHGTWLQNSATGNWTRLLDSGALRVAAGDVDGDRLSDLLGCWTDAPGLWIRYSGKGSWSKLAKESPYWISTGKLR